MSDDKNSTAKTNTVDEINKNKILVSKDDFQDKHSSCMTWIFAQGGLTMLGSIFLLPYAMKSIPFIRLTVELRLLTGLLCAIPLSSYVMRRNKERCEKRVEDTYYYKIKK